MYAYTDMYICMYIHISLSLCQAFESAGINHVRVCICVYVYIYQYVYIYIYVYICITQAPSGFTRAQVLYMYV